MPALIEDITLMLQLAEAEHHSAGWDNMPPTLYRICRAPGGYDVEAVNLSQFPDVHPRDALASLATLLPTAPLETGRRLYPYPPVSHMLVTEAWTSNLPEAERGGRALADIPGSREIRLAYAIVRGQHLLWQRIRGQEPELLSLDDVTSISGAMVEPLVELDRAAEALYRRCLITETLQRQGGPP